MKSWLATGVAKATSTTNVPFKPSVTASSFPYPLFPFRPAPSFTLPPSSPTLPCVPLSWTQSFPLSSEPQFFPQKLQNRTLSTSFQTISLFSESFDSQSSTYQAYISASLAKLIFKLFTTVTFSSATIPSPQQTSETSLSTFSPQMHN